LKIIYFTQSIQQINSDSLSGNNPKVQTKTVQNGGALFSPIQDDMLRTYHKVPQVNQKQLNLNNLINLKIIHIFYIDNCFYK
jgi:hypothetical protein